MPLTPLQTTFLWNAWLDEQPLLKDDYENWIDEREDDHPNESPYEQLLALLETEPHLKRGFIKFADKRGKVLPRYFQAFKEKEERLDKRIAKIRSRLKKLAKAKKDQRFLNRENDIFNLQWKYYRGLITSATLARTLVAEERRWKLRRGSRSRNSS